MIFKAENVGLLNGVLPVSVVVSVEIYRRNYFRRVPSLKINIYHSIIEVDNNNDGE